MHQLKGRVSDEAARGWDRWLTEHRVTRSAVLEAIGLELAAGRNPLSARVVQRAAEVDRARRSRR